MVLVSLYSSPFPLGINTLPVSFFVKNYKNNFFEEFKMETNEVIDSTPEVNSILEVSETEIETDSGKAVELTKCTRYGTVCSSVAISRDNWFRLNPPPVKRDTHPVLYRRKMICKRIEQITRTDHDTYKLLVQRDVENVEYITLDCRTILDIAPNEKDPGTITFLFEQYFTDEKQAELHLAYLRNEYDDLGDLPEF
jgi:hypothetical protein